MRNLLIPAVIAALLAGMSHAQEVKIQNPVMLDVDSDHGTCSIGWQVNAGGAALRAGPGAEFPLIALLPAGSVVAGCEDQDDWQGVIEGKDETCSIGIMVTTPQPYVGPCRSGWIELRLLTGIYG